MTTDEIMAKYFPGDTRSQYERMVAGELYIAKDPTLAELNDRALKLSAAFEATYPHDIPGSQDIARELFGSFGIDAHVRAPVRVDYGGNVLIGDRVFINANLTALDVAAIRIGDDCQIGPNVQLLTPTHPLDPVMRAERLESAEPITIEDNVWLGGGVIVCPGVTIGRNCVIGAGAVVTRDIPANSLAVGNPARVIRQLETTA